MDFHKTRTWQIVIASEKAAGFWPFQNTAKSGIICLLSFSILHSFAIPMVVRMLREWGENVYIVVENLVSVMLAYGTSFKVLAANLYRSSRAIIYIRITDQLKKLDDEESIIMRSYVNYGLKFTLAYIGFANLAAIVFDGPPMYNMIYSMIFSNGTTDKEFPYYMDYYVDNNKYFECMVLHLLLVVCITIVIVFAYDLSFVIAVQHTCALFNIATRMLQEKRSTLMLTVDVSHRLKKASEVAEKYQTVKVIFTESERDAYRLLTTAVDMHKEALEMVSLIEDAYSIAWFLKLIETVVETAALLSVLTLATNFYEFIGYFVYLAFTLVQFNVAFNRGQSLVDHASAVFDACYDLPWGDLSKESTTLLRTIMIRSFKVSRLTGGKIFPLTNVMYMKMLKTAFSYYTVISSYVGEEVLSI